MTGCYLMYWMIYELILSYSTLLFRLALMDASELNTGFFSFDDDSGETVYDTVLRIGRAVSARHLCVYMAFMIYCPFSLNLFNSTGTSDIFNEEGGCPFFEKDGGSDFFGRDLFLFEEGL